MLSNPRPSVRFAARYWACVILLDFLVCHRGAHCSNNPTSIEIQKDLLPNTSSFLSERFPILSIPKTVPYIELDILLYYSRQFWDTHDDLETSPSKQLWKDNNDGSEEEKTAAASLLRLKGYSSKSVLRFLMDINYH